MTNQQINKAALAHAKEQLGEEQYAKNKDAVKAISEDFKAGVNYFASIPRLTYPEDFTPELDFVLGWPNFKCGPYAQAFRNAGHNIEPKAEREQAFVLNWLIKLVLRHGADWAKAADAELQALAPAPAAAQEGEAVA